MRWRRGRRRDEVEEKEISKEREDGGCEEEGIGRERREEGKKR